MLEPGAEVFVHRFPRSGVSNAQVTSRQTIEDHEFGLQLILDTFDLPSFALDAEGRVVAWDDQIADLLGAPREGIIGSESLGADLYDSDQRDLTLAEKVVREPRDTHESYDGVALADGEYALLDGEYVYEDTSVIDGTEIWFLATPVFRGDDLVGVIEIVQDLQSSARFQAELEELFTALTATLEAYEHGNFGATVDFDREDSLLDEELLDIVADVNEMGGALESHILEVQTDVEQLKSSAKTITDQSQEINAITSEQEQSMETISGEVANLSATVEEIASTADNVAGTSSEAAELAEDGTDAAHDAVGVMENVADSADDVAEDVETLQSRVADIDEVAEVINDIAQQTNILALNASIEAARAGEAGDGFAVVANEVKDLAEESQEHAGRIEETIEEIQTETGSTVENLAETTERIEEGIEQVETVMASLDDIVDAITEATEGIAEVSRATDDQAASTEEISSMVDEAVDKAETVSDSIEDIVAATEEQTAMVENLNRSVEELTDDA
jgi:methyl-accepting chemotaxis protein